MRWFRVSSLLLLTVCSVITATLPFTAMAANGGPGSTGLFDLAEKFSDNERSAIETAISDVEAAGAPTVVYLQLLHTDDDRAVEYGQELMEDWEVESAPGARDGVVMFFNLDPDDTDRGEFGVVAGETHYEDGALPQSRLNSIRNEMIDLLADDRMAEAIVLGLEMSADYLESGPPEPTAFETFLDRIASGPVSILNALTLMLAAVVAYIGAKTWRDRPQATNVIEPVQTTPPSDLHPSIAGALVHGNIDHAQIEALLLDLAQNGAIALEPDPDASEKTRIQILNQRSAFSEAELALLSILVEQADEEGILDQDAIVRTQSQWPEVQEIIRNDLEERGWFNPDVGNQRRPLWVAGTPALIFGAVAGFIPAVVLEDVWPLVGGITLALVGLIMVSLAASFPRTTVEGQRQAAPWRGYQTGLKQAASDNYGSIDLDAAFPYIVSMGLINDFKDYLESASESGYVPLWVRSNEYQNQVMAPYWHVHFYTLHNSMHTAASGGATGAGGAATGSGGAGGRF